MNRRAAHLIGAIAALAAILAAGAPAVAADARGGGHGAGGGHFAGRGMGGGGRASAAPHFGRAHVSGGRYAAPRTFYGGGLPGTRMAGAGHVYGGSRDIRSFSGHPFSGVASSWRGGGWRGGGVARPAFGGYRSYWGGGYWHGRFWPRAYYGWNFPWFLPVLPIGFATFWWGGIPYYYADNVYYTWNADDNGYVVTNPPPVSDSDATNGGDTQYPSAGAADLYVYPKNGQSDEQTSNDRYECHKWAVDQTGFDPTRSSNESQSSATPSNYRRAMIACMDARGYSAR